MALRSITVKDLIELLEGEDETVLVIFSSDYGDHSHTPQALPLKGQAEEVFVRESAYSDSGYAVVDDEDEASEQYEKLGAGAPEQQYLLLK